MQKAAPKKNIHQPQRQNRPGKESRMKPVPITENDHVQSSIRLLGKTAVITGGDSGIGRAVALLFAKEGADIAIIYLNEHSDAEDTKCIIEEKYGKKCILVSGDISKETFCKKAISRIINKFQQVDILVNNAAIHYASKGLEEIT